MSVQKLPSGRWRAQVYDPSTRKNVSVSRILGGAGTFRTKTEAKTAREDARKRVRAPVSEVTVGEFWARWTSDRLFARPKESTNVHNRERTKHFAGAHGSLALSRVDDQVVAQWLAGGRRNGEVPALRAMFNDAISAKGGRLTGRNPFAGLGLRKSTGNRDVQPPTEEQAWAIIRAARQHTLPAFAAWLQVACFTGMRPGELDALRWDAIDFDAGRIRVLEQYSATTRTFTTPKNGRTRAAPLTGPAREALVALPRESEWAFTTLRGTHFTASARSYHWKATKAACGWTGSLYLATRHFAGWFMVNVLELPSEDVAIALGHTDGGHLVRILYGHRDNELALDRVAGAYARAANVRPLRAVREDTG